MLCEFCKKPINSIPYKCKYCYDFFCDEHHLPERHKCSNLPSKGEWFITNEHSEQKISDLEKENMRLQEILLGHIQSSMNRKEAMDLMYKNTIQINNLKDKKRN